MRNVASGGQSALIFLRAVFRFKELNALEASIRRTPSVAGSL